MTRRNDLSQPKDFLAVKGKFSLHITPQTPRGWRMGAVWTLAIILPSIAVGIVGLFVDGTPQERWIGWAVVPSLIATGLIIWSMIRWMLARADIISPQDLKDIARNRANRRD
jgi:hypothetical protein